MMKMSHRIADRDAMVEPTAEFIWAAEQDEIIWPIICLIDLLQVMSFFPDFDRSTVFAGTTIVLKP